MAVTTLRPKSAGRRQRKSRVSRVNARQVAARWLAAPQYELVPLHGAIDQARQLPAGATVTITSSPSRGVEATVALAEALAMYGLRTVPHLAARQITDEDELAEICRRLDEAGITDVFVVGGDATEPAGQFPDGLALLQALDRIAHGPPAGASGPADDNGGSAAGGLRSVGIPGYPEGHHLIDDETLWASLKAKAPYATYVVTQMCFDSEKMCRYVRAVHDAGIDLPVYVGMPGAVDAAKLLRISTQIGVGDSLRFVRSNAAVARRLLRPVGYRPDSLVKKLAARVADGRCDIAGLHLYTFNQVGATVGWVHQAETAAGAAGSAHVASGSAAGTRGGV